MIWLPVLLILVFVLLCVVRPFIRVRRLMQLHRSLQLQMKRDACLCVKCGYDVRHTTGGVCPECGWVIGRDPSESNQST